MWLLAAIGTAMCFGINNTLFKWGSTKGLSKVSIQFFFYLIAFVLVLTFGISLDLLHPSLLSISIGAIAGILNANANLQMVKAFEKGPASITSTLIAMNSIIPISMALIIFPETIHPIHGVGILLMICAAIFVQFQPKQQKFTIDYRPWLFSIFISLLSFGSVGFLMKFSASLHIHFLDMLMAMYGGGLIFLLFFVRKEKINLKEVRIASIIGTLSILGFSLYIYALSQGPASIVFPIISLNCLIVIIAGVIIFKEKLRYYQVMGIFIALIGIVLTKI